MSIEFGPEVGTQIATGTRLTPQLYEAVLTASEEARDERETLLSGLERERGSLQPVRDKLDDRERHAATLGVNARRTADPIRLDSVDAQLADIEAECAMTATARKQCLHNRRSRFKC